MLSEVRVTPTDVEDGRTKRRQEIGRKRRGNRDTSLLRSPARLGGGRLTGIAFNFVSPAT